MTYLPDQCPCCSGLMYVNCCQPFHQGTLPETALQLMRSRYCAYALDLPDYIMATTHPKNAQFSKNTFAWKLGISQFCQTTTFHKLEILEFQQKNHKASVHFKAHLTQAGKDASFTEKSTFEKMGNRWLYFRGQIN